MAAAQAGVVLRHIRELVQADGTSDLTDPELLASFLESRNEAAFTALVRRHGPLVLGVCRRVLGNHADAEDAFQATFLVLANKARAIARHQSLPCWLYQVAYRVALKAKGRAATRQKHEQRADERAFADPLAEITGRELLGVLDEELQRLAERHRAPLVLCYLEGNTCDEAARRLGCSPRTLKRWLDQARRCLGQRLTRRGLSLPATLLAAGAGQGASGASVPSRLVGAAAEAALGTGRVSSTALALANAVLRAGPGIKVWAASLVAALLGTVAVAAGLLAVPESARAPTPPQRRPALAAAQAPPPKVPAQPADKEGQLVVSGRVLAADGKPLKTAALAVVGRVRDHGRGGDLLSSEVLVLARGRADAEGRFDLSGPAASPVRFDSLFLLARGPGHGLALHRLDPNQRAVEVTLKLKRERIVRGRLVSLAGVPAAGVTVSMHWAGQLDNGQSSGISLQGRPPDLAVWPEPVKTDAQGRFAFPGVCATETAGLFFEGEGFAPQSIFLDPLAIGPVNRSLSPAQVIEGQVLQADTGKPIPHALLTVFASDREAGNYGGLGGKADAEGRFRLNPYPGKWFTVSAHPPVGEPYLAIEKRFRWDAGKVKRRLDLTLPRGVLVRGTLTEAGSGKPVVRAAVQYYPLVAQQPASTCEVVSGWQGTELSGADGTFQMAVLPGPGHLLVMGPNGRYVHEEIGGNVLYDGRPGGPRYYPDAVVKLDLPKEAREKKIALTLKRGVSLKGRLLGPDGQPVDKALMICKLNVSALSPYWRFPVQLQGGQFELPGVDPEKGCRVAFLEPVKGWGTTVEFSGKQAGEVVTVKLQPCGGARARYLDAQGKPVVGQYPLIDIIVTPGAWRYDPAMGAREKLYADEEHLANVDRHNYWNGPRTDAEGRCTFPALIPGITYRVTGVRTNNRAVNREFTVEAGKTLDLGDVPLKGSD